MTYCTACQRCDRDEIEIVSETAEEMTVYCPEDGEYTFAK